jgi:GT2 family glycosyltransferase
MDESMHLPRVSTILLNWNGLEDTRECLESLSKLDYQNHEVIVVDNGSRDGSVAAIRDAFADVTVLENAVNLGFTGGNNAGIRKAMERGAAYVWLLNNDTVVDAGCLRVLVEAGERSPEAGLLSPAIHFYDRPEEIQFQGSYIRRDLREFWKIERRELLEDEQVRTNLVLWGTALLIKRSTIERIGLLNDKYFAYHEDEEYGMRANRAGIRSVVVPEARVYHKNSRSTGGLFSPIQAFLRSRNLYFLWMDGLKGLERILHVRRYLAQVISYGGALKEEGRRESVDACLDGIWHAFRGAGGSRDPEIRMPAPVRGLFRFLFSWHPFLWSRLLSGDFRAIASNVRKRAGATQATTGRP